MELAKYFGNLNKDECDAKDARVEKHEFIFYLWSLQLLAVRH